MVTALVLFSGRDVVPFAIIGTVPAHWRFGAHGCQSYLLRCVERPGGSHEGVRRKKELFIALFEGGVLLLPAGLIICAMSG